MIERGATSIKTVYSPERSISRGGCLRYRHRCDFLECPNWPTEHRVQSTFLHTHAVQLIPSAKVSVGFSQRLIRGALLPDLSALRLFFRNAFWQTSARIDTVSRNAVLRCSFKWPILYFHCSFTCLKAETCLTRLVTLIWLFFV